MNKRHYEHTLPNIRGSLSNTYDRFGLSAIQDTFKRAFEEWKNNYKYLTELILVLNHKIWQYYETKPEFATLYNTLWEQAGQYAVENLKDDELSYYYEVTD